MNKDLKTILEKLTPEDLALAEKGCKEVSNYTLEQLFDHYDAGVTDKAMLAESFEKMIPGYIAAAKLG